MYIQKNITVVFMLWVRYSERGDNGLGYLIVLYEPLSCNPFLHEISLRDCQTQALKSQAELGP